jgi:hypothetical protein
LGPVAKTQLLDKLRGRHVLTERDVTTLWRQLFDGHELSRESLAEAEALLDGLSCESPLRIRLATELEETRRLQKMS